MAEPPPEAVARVGFDDVADALYEAHPDAFASVRDEAVKAARAQGNAPMARDLAKLRRPTLSAWMVNLLWRDQQPVLEQLFQIADGLALAQARAAAAEFRALLGLRREIE